MSFSIKFLNEPLLYPFDDVNTPAASGVLIIGDSKEGFVSSLYQWSKQQYETQWKQAVRILLEGNSKAALITEYLSPDAASHLQWWAMYREGETVYLQNHLLFYDQLEKPFSIENPYESLQDRETISQEGQQISEWSVSILEIEQFACMIGD
jgi:hypothetical protein